MTPATLLRRAAENITAESWCQGMKSTAPGRLCAGGHLDAVGCACGDMVPHQAAWVAVNGWIVTDPVSGRKSLPAWNDTPGRTAADVKALFLRVADELEAQG